jgi:protein dithiol:quinone oxidoreductase
VNGRGQPGALRARVLLPAAAALCVGAVAAALVSQHRFDMQPCAWCVLQRLIFLAIGAAALLARALPVHAPRRAGAGLMLLLSAGGVVAALWQHFVAAKAESCAFSAPERFMAWTGLDARFPDVFVAYASCADAKVDLWGLPYEFWSLGLFALLAAVALQVLRQPR